MRRSRTGGRARPARPVADVDPAAPVQIRMQGAPGDLAEVAAALGDVVDLAHVSRPYDNTDPARRGYGLQRLYLHARPRPPVDHGPLAEDRGAEIDRPRWTIQAELAREVLDAEYMAEKKAERPDLPPRELTPELWTVSWEQGEVYGKDDEVAALVGMVLADAHLTDAAVTWTLTGTPPQGRTLSEAVSDLGVTLYRRWPTAWR